MCYALILVVKEEAGELRVDRNNFRKQLLAFDDYMFTGPSLGARIINGLKTFAVNAVCPPVALTKILFKIDVLHGRTPNFVSATALSAGLVFYFGVVLLCMAKIEANLRMIAAVMYLGFCIFVCMARFQTRAAINCVKGDIFTDYLAAVLLYPMVLAQCDFELSIGPIIPAVEIDDVKTVLDKDDEGKDATPVKAVEA